MRYTIIKPFLFIITLFALSCNAQNSVTTNEVFVTKNNTFGVRSQSGKLLIDSVYTSIKVLSDDKSLLLPPREDRDGSIKLEYYVVTNAKNEKAVFDQEGRSVIDFVACENIAYITYSDLMVLVIEDAPNEEFYLYNLNTNAKLGPFEHFNIYNKEMSSFGFTALEAERLQNLNVITVLREVDNEYTWGIVDVKGNEVLPLAYRNFATMTASDKRHPAYKRATKPEGVEFVFRGVHISDPSVIIYFDDNFDQYEMKADVKKGEYKIEKR